MTTSERRIEYFPSSDGALIATATNDASGLPVLFTPADFTTIKNTWHFLLNELGDHHQVVAYDRRGTGLSERGEHPSEPQLFIDDAKAVVDGLGLGSYVIIGSATGCLDAIALAATDSRVTHLILANPVASGTQLVNLPRMQAALASLDKDWEWFSEGYAQNAYGWGNPTARPYAKQIRDVTSQAEAINMFATIANFEVKDDLSSVRAKTLSVTNPDWYYPPAFAREVAANIPGCRLEFGKDLNTMGPTLRAARAFFDETGESATEAEAGAFQTIMFTDLESSTALTQRLGDEGAQGLLRGHNTAVRAALGTHGGREVKHTGDGIMASFPSAVSAVTAALDIQSNLGGGQLRVRIGLNAGEPIAEDDDLFGTAVQLAARITDRAEPGQVLVSNVVRELCAGKTFKFEPLGEASLKGFDELVTLFEVNLG